jgi:GNAT superfamily N-acetyltransferase
MILKQTVFFVILICSGLHASHDDLPRIVLQTSALNPARGFTVWRSPPQTLTFSWLSYGSFTKIKHHTEQIDGDFEITISPYTCSYDNAVLIDGLDRYDRSKLAENSFDIMHFNLPGLNINGFIRGEAALIFYSPNRILTKEIISYLENWFVQKCVRQIFIQLNNYQKGLGPLYAANDTTYNQVSLLKDTGFSDLSGCVNFMTGSIEGWFLKEPLEEQRTPHILNNISVMTRHSIVRCEPPLYSLSNHLSVFVRDQRGIVQGGALCSYEPDAFMPHIYVHAFYMNETVRGTGLGKTVMTQLESYTRYLKIPNLLLGTCDHQAPWFYEKIGYKRLYALPKQFQDRQGHYLTEYDYVKTL